MEEQTDTVNRTRIIGLSHINTDAGFGHIDYGFMFNYMLSKELCGFCPPKKPHAVIYESGIYVPDVKINLEIGDVYEIARQGNAIHYIVNNRIVYESFTDPSKPLLTDVSFMRPGVWMSGVEMTAMPTTKLRDEDCSATDVALDQPLYAIPVPGATGYEFLVKNSMTGEEQIITSANNFFSCIELATLPEDYALYNIKVRAILGTSQSPYSDKCSIRIMYRTQPGNLYVKLNDNFQANLCFNVDSSYTYNQEAVSLLPFISQYGIQSIKNPFGKDDLKLQRTYRVYFSQYRKQQELIDEFSQLSFMEYAEPVSIARPCIVPEDDLILNQQPYYLNTIKAFDAWDISTGSNEIIIAITDNDFLADHEDLIDNIWVNQAEIPAFLIPQIDLDNVNGVTAVELRNYIIFNGMAFDFNGDNILSLRDVVTQNLQNQNLLLDGTDNDENTYIDDIIGYDVGETDSDPFPIANTEHPFWGHGTHVAGIAGARTDNGTGIASLGFNTKIMLVKNNDAAGNMAEGPESINYARLSGADIINMSWHIPDGITIQNAINAAVTAGIILVASAGNDNVSTLTYPAAYDDVIAVGATDANDLKWNDAWNSGSNFSSLADNWVDVMAPGVQILSTMANSTTSYGYRTGTSMACPVVSALCGLMLSYAETNNLIVIPNDVKNCIEDHCDPIDAINDPLLAGLLGHGRINAFQALGCLAPNPVACFTAEPEVAILCAGTPAIIQFNDESAGTPTLWFWQFENGAPATSDLQTPAVINNSDADAMNCGFVENGFDLAGRISRLGLPNCYMTPRVNVEIENVIAPLCNGQCNGQATATPMYGTAPYTFVWSYGETNQTAMGLCHGQNSVTVTDNFGCQDIAYVTITEPDELLLQVFSNDASCFNNDGTATVIPSGGVPSYVFDWSPNGFTGDGTPAYSNLPAGNYTVTVTDDNLCTAVANVIIATFDISITGTNINCFGENSGSATATVTGGTSPYSYDWEPNGFTNDFTNTYSNLTAGSYTVTVTDNSGCSSVNNIIIAQPPTLTITSSITNITCYDMQDGAIDLSVSGGTPDYSYLWSNGATIADLVNISADNYSVTVTDANECMSTLALIVTEPPELTVTVNITNQCVTDLWSNGSTTPSISTLCAGNYSVTVTDLLGCSYTADFSISEGITVDIEATLTCPGLCDGTATANVSGGIPPYSYIWCCNEPNPINTQITTSLCPVLYSVTVTDVIGCSDIGNVKLEVAQPLSIILTGNDIACNGDNDGSTDLTIIGGKPPINIMWTGPIAFADPTAEDQFNLIAGTYSVSVSDACGQTADAQIIITEPQPLTIMATAITNVTCYSLSNGSISIVVNGGTLPYIYSWSGPGGQPFLYNLSEAPAGTYYVTVTDYNSCSITQSFVITQPSQLTVTFGGLPESCAGQHDGQITATPFGGTPDYDYLWDDVLQQTTSTLSNLAPGDYTVTITDDNECTIDATGTVLTNPGLFTNPPLLNNITGIQSWTGGTYQANDNIEIQYGGVLTLNHCIIQFAEYAGIIVHIGGKLRLIYGSQLSGLTSCDNMWQGITMYGDHNTAQPASFDPATDTDPHHGVVVIDNSTIRGAFTGIFAGDPSIKDTWHGSGGIVIIRNGAIIKNCHRGVVFKGFGYENHSILIDCQLFCDNTFADLAQFTDGGLHYINFLFGQPAHSFIHIMGGNIELNTVTVYNNYSANPISNNKRGTGLSAISTMIDDQIIYCTFTDLYKGIEGSFDNLTISECTFTNVMRGITLWPPWAPSYINGVKICRNNFDIPAVPGQDTYGIYTVAADNFLIKDNDFKGVSNNPTTYQDPATYGVIVENSGSPESIVWGNYFTGTDYGVQSQADNSNLMIKCNSFGLNKTSLINTPNNMTGMTVLQDYTGTYGDLEDQGIQCDLVPPNTDKLPANQWFEASMDYCDNAVNPSSEKEVIVDPDIHFNYYSYSADENNQLYPRPDCSTDTWWITDQNVSNVCVFNMNEFTCSVIPVGIPPPIELPGYIDRINSELASYRSQTEEIDSVLMIGDSQQIVDMVLSDASEGHVKNAIIAISPYTSDRILITALTQKPTPLPPGHVKQIIEANSPVTEPVYEAVEACNLPQGIMNQINSAQVGISELQRAEDDFERIETEIVSSELKLATAYVLNNQYNSAVTLLNQSHESES
ncbi:MAG: S8 family serine peptidase, partial [Bacteroidia bacterium]|nr:S8 family serine peptidase [Bacteroidia bacterium]